MLRRRGLAIALLLAGCSGAIHDPLIKLDAGAGDALVDGRFTLASYAVNGTLYAMRLVGTIGTLDIVSISEGKGIVTSLLQYKGTVARDLMVDDNYLYWTELPIGRTPQLYRAKLDGTGAALFFDPAASGSAPPNAELATAYLSPADDRVFVVLTVGSTVHLGSLPRSGTDDYSELASFSAISTPSFAAPAISLSQQRAYVATHDGMINYIVSMPVTMLGQVPKQVGSDFPGDSVALTSDDQAVYWVGYSRQIITDPSAAAPPPASFAPGTTSRLALFQTQLLGTATVGNAAALWRLSPMTGGVETLAQHPVCANDQCIALPPTLTLDGTTAYFSTGMAVYAISLQ